MMSRQDILLSLRRCLPIKEDEVTDSTTFQSLGMDSLDFIQFLIDAEQELGVAIPNAAAWNFRTLGDVAQFIESRTS